MSISVHLKVFLILFCLWYARLTTEGKPDRIELEMPHVAIANDHVDLICHYDLDDSDSEPLYSIKFYRNGEEFYRFLPRDEAPVRVFRRKGLHVQQIKGQYHHNWIRLIRITEDTEGLFKCEVSREGPTFVTHSDEKELRVRDNPKDPPQLRYDVDANEEIIFRCSSPDLNLIGRFNWNVNGRNVVQQNEMQDSRSIVKLKLPEDGIQWIVECRLIIGMQYNRSVEVVLFQEKTDAAQVQSSSSSSRERIFQFGMKLIIIFYILLP